MPMATNEPKVSSSTTIAATIPIPVAGPSGGSWTCWMA